jgi:hypothetical protein
MELDADSEEFTSMAPSKKAPKPRGIWQPGDKLVHSKHGSGTISKIIRHGEKTWLEVKFGYDYLQIAPSDPAIQHS